MSDLEKSFDSQETVSEERTEIEFNSVMSKPKSEKGKRRNKANGRLVDADRSVRPIDLSAVVCRCPHCLVILGFPLQMYLEYDSSLSRVVPEERAET